MNNLVGMFFGVWLHPWASMRSVKNEAFAEAPAGSGLIGRIINMLSNIKRYMAFILVTGLLSGIITAIVGLIMPSVAAGAGSKAVLWLSILIVPAVSFLGSFIGALIIWGLVDALLRGTLTQYGVSYRILALLAAFSPVSAVLSAIPTAGQYLAIAVNIWATIVMIRGIIIVRGTPPVRTWITCGILFAFLFVLGVFARLAAQRQIQNQGRFSEFGAADDFGGDFSEGDDLDKQLQELAEQAQSGPSKK